MSIISIKKAENVVAFSDSELKCLNDFCQASLAESSLAYVVVNTIKDIYMEADQCWQVYYKSLENGDVNYYAQEAADIAEVHVSNLSYHGFAGEIITRSRPDPFPETYFYDFQKGIYTEK